MKKRDFELRLLDLVFTSSERLTPHLVAYRLNIPFSEAREHLDRMVKEGVLTLEMDERGNTWYEAPGVERPQRAFSPVPPMMTSSPPALRVAAAPRSTSGLSVLWILAGGMLVWGMLGFFFPVLLFFGIFALCRLGRARRYDRYHWSYNRGYFRYPFSGGCGRYRVYHFRRRF